MFQDTLWWEWLLILYLTIIGPLVSYYWIRHMTKLTHNGKLEITGTEIVDGKFVISDPKKFLPIFVIFSVIGLPFLIMTLISMVLISP